MSKRGKMAKALAEKRQFEGRALKLGTTDAKYKSTSNSNKKAYIQSLLENKTTRGD